MRWRWWLGLLRTLHALGWHDVSSGYYAGRWTLRVARSYEPPAACRFCDF